MQGAKTEEIFRLAGIIHSQNDLHIYVICVFRHIQQKSFAFQNCENLGKHQLINVHIISLKQTFLFQSHK